MQRQDAEDNRKLHQLERQMATMEALLESEKKKLKYAQKACDAILIEF